MRFGVLGSLVGAALVMALSMLPAEAAWRGYFSKEPGFSFTAPGEFKAEKVTYISTSAGQRTATLFRSIEDNVEYKVTVVDLKDHKTDESTAVKEASTLFIGDKKILNDEDARVDSSYGRKMTFDLPNNGGRTMGAVYFKDGYLIQLESTVLPANGDYLSPDMGRFVDSLAFYDSRVDPGALELTLIK